eukprot:11066059-Alexandrium_andersonii.AAC.1
MKATAAATSFFSRRAHLSPHTLHIAQTKQYEGPHAWDEHPVSSQSFRVGGCQLIRVEGHLDQGVRHLLRAAVLGRQDRDTLHQQVLSGQRWTTEGPVPEHALLQQR